MKKADVQIGATYRVKVSNRIVPVRVLSQSERSGWIGVNLETGRQVRIKSAQRLRSLVSPPEGEERR